MFPLDIEFILVRIVLPKEVCKNGGNIDKFPQHMNS